MILYDPIIQSIPVSPAYQTDVLRLDLLHPEISGNKWFKLKYNLEQVITGNLDTIITFGGAFSNHIAATAAACKLYNIKSAAIIRGEEPAQLNATLQKAQEDGMQLHFVSREHYAQKNGIHFNEFLLQQFGKHYLIPEGGNNVAGLLGCKEILNAEWNYDHIFCACGTATTFAGLASSVKTDQTVIGISVLKGKNKLPAEAEHLLHMAFPGTTLKISGNEVLTDLQPGSHGITNAYCFSGYAGYDKELAEFKNSFEKKYQIPLDHVYTTKLFYAVTDLLKEKKLKPGSRSLIIHSGGLQGNAGFEKRYHLMPML